MRESTTRAAGTLVAAVWALISISYGYGYVRGWSSALDEAARARRLRLRGVPRATRHTDLRDREHNDVL